MREATYMYILHKYIYKSFRCTYVSLILRLNRRSHCFFDAFNVLVFRNETDNVRTLSVTFQRPSSYHHRPVDLKIKDQKPDLDQIRSKINAFIIVQIRSVQRSSSFRIVQIRSVQRSSSFRIVQIRSVQRS